MKLVSLFSGIGGFDLGFQRAGIETAAFCEIDPYCQKVLKYHWPEVPLCPLIQLFPLWWEDHKDESETYVVSAGFPCQPFSFVGKQEGIEDDRWLWPETAEAIRAIRPKFVFLENVAALVSYGDAFGTVLSDLHQMGFDAQWGVVSAAEFGAPTKRPRLVVLSHSRGEHGSKGNRVVSTKFGRITDTTSGLPRPSRTERWISETKWRESEPRVRKLVDGLPVGLVADRLRGLGNAIVPQVAEYYAQYIVALEEQGIA